MELGELIRRIRLERKQSQAELAAFLGLNAKTGKQQVSAWENGRSVPDKILAKLQITKTVNFERSA